MSSPTLVQVSENVHLFPADERTDRPIFGAVCGQKGTLIVDAGNSEAHANLFLAELSRHGIASPTFLVLTHAHWDHVFGITRFDIPTFASQETRQIVTEMAQLDWSDEALDRRVEDGTEIEFCRDMIKAELPDRTDLTLRVPDITFTAQVEIDLGDITCQVVHVGGDYASDSTIVYVPEEKVLFLGDCIYPDLHSGPRSYTTRKTVPLVDQLLSYDAEFFLFSHDSEPMSRRDFVDFATSLKTIGQAVEKYGDNREEILQEVAPTAAGTEISSEDLEEMVEEFLAGYRKG